MSLCVFLIFVRLILINDSDIFWAADWLRPHDWPWPLPLLRLALTLHFSLLRGVVEWDSRHTESRFMICIHYLHEGSRAMRRTLVAQNKFLRVARHVAIFLSSELNIWFQRFFVLKIMTHITFFVFFDFLPCYNRIFLNTHLSCWGSSHALILTIICHLTWEKVAPHCAIPHALSLNLRLENTHDMIFIPIHSCGWIMTPWLAPSLHKIVDFVLFFLQLFNIFTELLNKLTLIDLFVLLDKILSL